MKNLEKDFFGRKKGSGERKEKSFFDVPARTSEAKAKVSQQKPKRGMFGIPTTELLMRCELVRCILACQKIYQNFEDRSPDKYDEFVFMLIDIGQYSGLSLHELLLDYEKERFHAALAHYYFANSITDYHAKTGRKLESLEEKKYGAWSAILDLEKGRFSGKKTQDVLEETQALTALSPELFASHKLEQLPHFDIRYLETLSESKKPVRLNPDTHPLLGETETFPELSEAARILREGYVKVYLRALTEYDHSSMERRFEIRQNITQEARKKLNDGFSSASLHELRCFALYAELRAQVERFVWFSASNSQRDHWNNLSAPDRRENLHRRGEKLLSGKFKGKSLEWVREQAEQVNTRVMAAASKQAQKKKSASGTSTLKKPSLFARLGFGSSQKKQSDEASTPSNQPAQSRNIDQQRARRAMEIYSALYFEHPTEFVDPAFLNPRYSSSTW